MTLSHWILVNVEKNVFVCIHSCGLLIQGVLI